MNNTLTPSEKSLLLAVSENDASKVKKLLADPEVRANLNLDAEDKNGYTALMIATESGNVEIIKNLLIAGADPDIPHYPIGITAWDLIHNRKRISLVFEESIKEWYNKIR